MRSRQEPPERGLTRGGTPARDRAVPRHEALANSEELAGKAAVRTVMMMKQEAINVEFGGVASVPPSAAPCRRARSL
jgi:hypothetical protein